MTMSTVSDASKNLTQRVCTFTVGGLLFGIDVMEVHEILRAQHMTRVPLAPDTVRGLINLRGQIVTAIDMRARLQFPPIESGDPPTNVVVRHGTGSVSLLVDEIGDVLSMDDARYERTPELLSPVIRDLVDAVYKLDDRLLLILNASRIPDIAAVGDRVSPDTSRAIDQGA